jgi:ABC-type transporter Mla subunit MlaD
MSWLDDAWIAINRFRGVCTATQDLQDLSEQLERASRLAQTAENIAEFTRQSGNVMTNIRRAREAIDSATTALSTLTDVCANVTALDQVRTAVVFLNQPNIMRTNPEESARQFGQMFVGLGQFMTYLPPPINSYARILQGCGDFFVNMQRLLDPASDATPRGRQMRELNREMGWSG